MPEILSKPGASKMLASIEPRDVSAPEEYSRRRRRILLAACSATQLFVREPSKYFDARGTTPDWQSNGAADWLHEVAALRSSLAEAKVASVGLHIVDPVCGRLSRMWTSNDWRFGDIAPYPESERFSWVFAHLWLKAYWHLLRTSSTLLNALHEGSLPWNGVHLFFGWDEAQPVRSVFKLSPTDRFVTGSRVLAKRFAEVIGHHAEEVATRLDTVFREWSSHERGVQRGREPASSYSEYYSIVDASVTHIVETLTRECFVAQTRELCEDLRRRTLVDRDVRQALISTLDALEGSASELSERVNSWSAATQEVRHSEEWAQVLVRAEALQSCIMNEAAWATGSILVDRIEGLGRIEGSDSTCYLVLGLDESGDAAAVESTILQLNRSIGNLLQATQESLDVNRVQIPVQRRAAQKRLRDELLSHIPGAMKGSVGLSRWLDLVTELASAAIHERQPLRFTLGYGPAFLAQTQLRAFERSPAELSLENTDPRRIANFIKAFFSLFGARNRVVWFDPQGCFMGIYESPSQHIAADWLFRWGQRKSGYYISRILGPDWLEIHDAAGNPLVRAIDGRVTKQAKDSDLRAAIDWAIRPLFSKDWYSEAISSLAASLVANWKRAGHGTSLVIEGDLDKDEGDDIWRAPLSTQLRSLVPRLRSLERPILSLEGPGDAKKEVASAEALIAPFGEIDGATILRCKAESGSLGVTCLPGRQVVPLVPLNGADGERGPLDFESWASSNDLESFDSASLPSIDDRTVLSRRQAQFVIATLQDPSLLEQLQEGRDWIERLEFLQSAGTRHHSLWGISLTAREQLVAVTLSDDGKLGVFWDGRNFMTQGS